jgi:hypothetical protein
MRKTVFVLLAALALAASASAQQVSTYTFERKVSADQPPQVLLDKIKLDQWQIAVQAKTVQNAPYSAEATNESTQILPDGNRIVHRTTTRVYRDSAGRTRKETLDDNGQVVTVMISDPTTGKSYVFDSRGMLQSEAAVAGTSARITAERKMTEGAAAAGQITVSERVAVGGAAGGAGASTVYFVNGAPEKGETAKEDLGQQAVQGVAATGTRTTTTIPAGAIGNEQPIKIVSEEWYSPELQVLVQTRHSDPRTGETTYRLSNIDRSEPAKSLFDAPAGK